MIFKKLRGRFMDSIAIRHPSIAFSINGSLKANFREIGRIAFSTDREDIENYELPIEDSKDLPKTREVGKSIKKMLNRLVNNRIVTSPLTIDIYNNFIDVYETDPDFKPQGEILEMLTLTYDCYIQAYLTDLSSKSNFWNETPESSRQEYLEHFYDLIKWRLKNPATVNFFDRVQLAINLTNFAYGINIKDLVNDYRNNIDLYIQNILNILDLNRNDVIKVDSQLKDSGLFSGVSRDNTLFSYHVKDLFLNQDVYEYTKKQEHLFDLHLPKLVEEYAGQYIVFENGVVVDSDSNESILLDRISETKFFLDRRGLFIPRVPNSLSQVNV